VKYGHYYTAIASWCGFKINGFELSELTNAAAGALFLGILSKKRCYHRDRGCKSGVYTYPLTLNIIATDEILSR
jgi:hypothetical protein